MRFFSLLLGVLSLPAQAAEIPIHVQYVRAGTEPANVAEKLGQAEIENGNPCVAKMRRELGQFARGKEMSDAVETVLAAGAKDFGLQPHLVLRYLNESMELRFELRKPAVKDDGYEVVPESVVSRKGIVISKRPGSWKERMDGDHCVVTERNFTGLVEAILESERLKACEVRKLDLLKASRKISNYIHNYMPVSWIDEARRKLAEQRYEVTGVLREDIAIYREGNETYRECAKGLKLLEEEAAASVRVLNEVKASKRGTDIPRDALEALENKLTNSAQ